MVYSVKKKIICRVPLSSVLGSIFFTIYINRVYNIEVDGQTVTCVDDKCLHFSDTSWKFVNKKATNEFKKKVLRLNR